MKTRVYLPLPIPNLWGNHPITCSGKPNPSKRQGHQLSFHVQCISLSPSPQWRPFAYMGHVVHAESVGKGRQWTPVGAVPYQAVPLLCVWTECLFMCVKIKKGEREPGYSARAKVCVHVLYVHTCTHNAGKSSVTLVRRSQCLTWLENSLTPSSYLQSQR